MKKVLSIILSMVMLLSMSVTAFAAESNLSADNSVAQVVEANGVRTATYSDSTTTYIVTYDTVNNTICVAHKDIETGTVTYGSTVSTNISTPTARAASSTVHQDTFSNYEYDIYTGNPNEWNLERPDDDGEGQRYFMVYENSSNEEELDAWFEAVNALNNKEWEAVSGYGVSLVTNFAAGVISGMAIASGGILTPGAITAIVAATGATGAAAVLLAQIGTCCNVCRMAYQDVFNATDNMHF